MSAVNQRMSSRVAAVRLRKGLDLVVTGAPRQVIERARAVRSIALVGSDYVGLRPKLLVEQGRRVRLGEPLLADRRDPRIVLAAPGSGTVASIHIGERRSLLSVVVSLGDQAEESTFPTYSPRALGALPREDVIENLLRSGSWTALRSRPFGRIPLPDAVPRAIFVTAIDTHPLAPRPELVIAERRDDFAHGLLIIGRLADCPVFLCTAPGTELEQLADGTRVTPVTFAGPHPAGLPGTHIHLLSPAAIGHESWHIGYQDVIAIGRLFTTGRLCTERVVALAGPGVRRPRLLRTRLGADLSELLVGELHARPMKVISGSVLAGRRAIPPCEYLGRYHVQVSVLDEPPGEARPPRPSLVARLARRLRAHSGAGAPARRRLPPVLPLASFERVVPLEILPTPLLRALAIGDTERAMELGCLELEEEDLALCSFLCPSQLDYGFLLRRVLTQIEKEL